MKLDLFKIIIAISFLIISSSIGYYFVIFLPQKENQKIEQQRIQAEQKRKEVEQKQKDEEISRMLLTNCLLDADVSYHNNWNAECKSQGKLSQECINLVNMTLDEYMEENNIPNLKRIDTIGEFAQKQSDCSCRLPLDNSDRIDGWRDSEKSECYKKYGN